MSEEEYLWDCSNCNDWDQGDYNTWGGHVCYKCWEFHDMETPGPCFPCADLTDCGWNMYRQALTDEIKKREGRT